MISKEQASDIRHKLDSFFENGSFDAKGQDRPQIGLEIIDTHRFAERLKNRPGLVRKIFTAREIDHCGGNLQSLAGRLAAKKAVCDALKSSLRWKNIDIIRSNISRQPIVELSDGAAKNANLGKDHHVPISISHEREIAVAFAARTNTTEINLLLGTDIASTDRIAQAHRRWGERFLIRQYTSEEIDQAGGDLSRLTAIWAAKEAVAKALGTGFWHHGVAWTDVSILSSDDGLENVILTGGALSHALEKNVRNWNLNILADPKTPAAFVIGY